MGGFAALAGALGSILSGQQQGKSQTDLYQQQLRQRQLDQQLQTQLLAGKVQDMGRADTARGTLSTDEQKILDLGGSMSDITKRRAQATQAGSIADQLYQRSLDPTLTIEERMQAAQLSSRIRTDPSLVDKLPEEMKIGGIAEKQPVKPFHPFTASGEVKAFEGYDPTTGKPTYETLGSVPVKETATSKMMETPVGMLKGLNIVTPDGKPWPNPLTPAGEAMKAGGVTLSDKGKDALALNDAADQDLDNLLAAGQAVLPSGSGGLKNVVNPAALAAKRAMGDPDVASYDAAKIGLITHLRAVANAARVNQQELAQVNSAMANANSYPALQKAIAQARSLLAKSRKYLVKAGTMDPTAAANPAPSADRRPVYDAGGKLIGYTTDGKTMVAP